MTQFQAGVAPLYNILSILTKLRNRV